MLVASNVVRLQGGQLVHCTWRGSACSEACSGGWERRDVPCGLQGKPEYAQKITQSGLIEDFACSIEALVRALDSVPCDALDSVPCDALCSTVTQLTVQHVAQLAVQSHVRWHVQ